jgi:hypothetical protein
VPVTATWTAENRAIKGNQNETSTARRQTGITTPARATGTQPAATTFSWKFLALRFASA